MVKFLILPFFILLLCSPFSFSHPLDLGLLNITGSADTLHVRLELNPQIGQRFLKSTASTVSNPLTEDQQTELLRATLGSSIVSVNEQPCQWSEKAVIKIENPQLLAIDTELKCSTREGQLKIELPFLKNLESTYHLLARIQISGVEHVGGADPENNVLSFNFKSKNLSLLDFIVMGVEHIGVAPSEWSDDSGLHLPLGIDHILFVLALVLSGGGLIQLSKTITGFTIGHTTSLILVAAKFFQFPGQWIEALIALTICWVATETLFNRRVQHRLLLTIFFGVIHGLAFSTALQGLNLSSENKAQAVLGFNLGIELGQFIIVLLAYPLFQFIRKSKAFGNYGLRGLAAVILAISIFWFIQRAFAIGF